MQLKQPIENTLLELEAVLLQIDGKVYTTPAARLFGATIGQHVRHIVELFQCLEAGYETGAVNYDKRKRNLRIETDVLFAIQLMHEVTAGIKACDKDMTLYAGIDTEGAIHTNYLRELYYNLEHTIHHMALIRVGIGELSTLQVSANFGLAPSTIQYRKACAQ
ncbi:MAG: DinB family protein [Bacteroidetes bacterium]|nr:DinB family protein [Bacteroidota bacterium]